MNVEVSPLEQALLDANAESRKFLAELEEAARAMGHMNADEVIEMLPGWLFVETEM